MSSEAAYFPNTVARTAASRAPVHCASESPSAATHVSPTRTNLPDRRLEASIPIPEITDELLLKQVSEGDKEALGLLFRRYARNVRNVAYRILRNEAEADDLVQDVFLRIFRKAALFDSRCGAARSWIFHLTYFLAFDRRRYLNSRHFYASQELVDISFRLADPREELPFHERSMEGILGKALMERFNRLLSPEQRETIQLYFFEGYAFKEIAQLTGRPLINVRNHYYRGLDKMRKYVLPENFGQSE